MTQQFFARFLNKEQYKQAERERGRFRSFLLTSVKRFLINAHESAIAQKRGGGIAAISLDEQGIDEDNPRLEIWDERTAERIYERNWAMTLLAEVRSRLESAYASEGKRERFAQLEQFLPGEEPDKATDSAGISVLSCSSAVPGLGMVVLYSLWAKAIQVCDPLVFQEHQESDAGMCIHTQGGWLVSIPPPFEQIGVKQRLIACWYLVSVNTSASLTI